MGQKFRKYVCTAVILHLVFTCQSSVIWKIQTVPIVFGDDVHIKCFVPTGACHINQTRQWTGGKGYKLIGLNGITTNVSKYEMKVYKSDLSFDLIVKNFSEGDANSEYTCLCGKEQYTDMLLLNKTDYIIMPAYDEIIDHSYVDDNILYINITLMKIHPLPNCTFHYNDKTKILKTSHHKIGHNTYDIIRYNETISVRYLNIFCKITWFVNCVVGEKSFQTNNNKHECAIDNDVKIRNVVIAITAVASSCIFVALFVFLKRHCFFKRNVNQEGKEQQSKSSSQPEENISMLNTSIHA